ncbi:MAG TPA: ROK family protein [Pseudolysinimonas sp.]|nr:ROK family protein [Pseudolysinimonas sp.]
MARDREAGEVTDATVSAIMQALLAHGPSTRAEIMADAGLSRPTVSRTVTMLLRDGAIEQVKDGDYTGRGRPSHLVRLSSRRADTLGIELGRRHVAFAITDISGRVVLSASLETNSVSSLVDHASEALAFVINQTRQARVELGKLRGIAVGTPGPRYRRPEGQTATDVSLARLSRERALVAEVVSRQFVAPVSVGNNTRYTALAEADRRRDAGLAADDLVYLRVDEGIGGGIVTGGELRAGAWDAAGEMGHVSVDLNGEPCFCGGRGCLELVAALPAVIRAAGATDLDDLRERSTRDPAAAAAINAAARATAGVVAGVLAVVNPSVLVIGGSVASLPGFIEQVETIARATAPSWATLDLVVEAAATDHLLGAIGAAAAAHAALEGTVPLVKRDA